MVKEECSRKWRNTVCPAPDAAGRYLCYAEYVYETAENGYALCSYGCAVSVLLLSAAILSSSSKSISGGLSSDVSIVKRLPYPVLSLKKPQFCSMKALSHTPPFLSVRKPDWPVPSHVNVAFSILCQLPCLSRVHWFLNITFLVKMLVSGTKHSRKEWAPL